MTRGRGRSIGKLLLVTLIAVLALVALDLAIALLRNWDYVTGQTGRRLELIASEPAEPAPAEPIILIVADSARQDVFARLLAQDRLPHLQGLVARATTYTHCQAVSSHTRPSTSALLTGRFPHELGTHTGPLPEQATTLAEHLRQAGYETIGSSANYIVSEHTGFAQGHTFFWQANLAVVLGRMQIVKRLLPNRWFRWFTRQTRTLYTEGDDLNRRIATMLERREPERPLYLYAHYMDTHYPYYGPGVPYYEILDELEGLARPPFHERRDRPEVRASFMPRYEAAYADCDRFVGELFALLGTELLDRALVIFTADHGEEFFEHGWFSHGATLYDESVRVPLVVKRPRQRSPELVERPVSGFLVPDIIMGIEHEGIYAELDRYHYQIFAGWFDGKKRLLSIDPKGQVKEELYDDLREDANAFPAVRLAAADSTSFVSFVRSAAAAETPAMSDAERDRLRSLGYVN